MNKKEVKKRAPRCLFALYSDALRKKHVERTERQKIQKTITGAQLPLRFENAAFFRKIPLFPPLYYIALFP